MDQAGRATFGLALSAAIRVVQMAGTDDESTTDLKPSGPPTTVFIYPGGRARCTTIAIGQLGRLVAALPLHQFVPLNDAFAQAKGYLGSYSLAAHDLTQHARARRLTLGVRVISPDGTEQALILRLAFWRWYEIYDALRPGAGPPQRSWATVRQVCGKPTTLLGAWHFFVGRRRFERLYSTVALSKPAAQSPRARSGGSRKTPEQPPTTAKEFVPYAVRRWPRREDEGAGEYVDRLLRHAPHKWSRHRIQNLLSELKPSQRK